MPPNSLTTAIVVQIILLVAGESPAISECPVLCTGCNMGTLACERPGLRELPKANQAEISKIKISQQNFTHHYLEQKNFSHYTLPTFEIRELFITNCSLLGLKKHTFSPLNVLKILDLSHNQLRDLGDAPFNGLHLRTLILDGNVGIRLRAAVFFGLQLDSLSLRGCGLLTRDVVSWNLPVLPNLRSLYMSQNQLSHAPYEVFLPLVMNLTTMDLTENPLQCSCHLVWLSDWMLSPPPLSPAQGASGLRKANCLLPPSDSQQRSREIAVISLRKHYLQCGPPRVSGLQMDFLTWDMAQLTCSVQATSKVVLQWRNTAGEKIVSVPPTTVTEISYLSPKNEHAVSILIRRKEDGKMEAEVDNYTCYVEDYFGNVSSMVRVQWPPKKEVTPPSTSPDTTTLILPVVPGNISSAERPYTAIHLLMAVFATFILTLLTVACILKIASLQRHCGRKRRARGCHKTPPSAGGASNGGGTSSRQQHPQYQLCHRNEAITNIPYESSNTGEYQIYDVPSPTTAGNPPQQNIGPTTPASPPAPPPPSMSLGTPSLGHRVPLSSHGMATLPLHPQHSPPSSPTTVILPPNFLTMKALKSHSDLPMSPRLLPATQSPHPNPIPEVPNGMGPTTPDLVSPYHMQPLLFLDYKTQDRVLCPPSQSS